MPRNPFSVQAAWVYDRLAAVERELDQSPSPSGEALGEALRSLRAALDEMSLAGDEPCADSGEPGAARWELEAQTRHYRDMFESAPCAHVVTNADAKILQANRAAAGLLNVLPQFLVGKPLVLFVAEGERREFLARLSDLSGCAQAQWETCIQPRGRAPLLAHVSISAVHVPSCARGISLRWLIHPFLQKDDADPERAQTVGPDRAAWRGHVGRRRMDVALSRERAARVEAERANAAKDQLLTIVAHELRNPLSSILAGVEAIRRQAPQDEVVARMLDAIDRSARLQARLVDDILDLSRMRTGKLPVTRRPVALEPIVLSAVQDQQAAAAAAGLELAADVGHDTWVLGDSDRLLQMVTNLVANAIKFTHPGGSVRVTVRECGSVGVWGFGGRGDEAGTADTCETPASAALPHSHTSTLPHSHTPTPPRARLTVEDTGIGIDAPAIEHVFGMFWQDEAGANHPGGLGIGLSVVGSIAGLHGGRVWAESEGAGKGSRFVVELPILDRAADAGDPHSDARVELAAA